MKSGKMHKEHDWLFLFQKDIALEKLTLQQTELSDVKWIPLDVLIADLSKLDWKNHYAGRNKYIYEITIKAVQKQLAKG